MIPTIEAELPPLRVDERGAIRIGDSRVTLDLVVREFEQGADPESIARAYDTLALPDIYGAIAYYLRYKDEVTAYIGHREAEADELQRKIEAAQGPSDLRARLLARRAEREGQHAAPRD
jgi:uncharacterized protein (DUF433 family)